MTPTLVQIGHAHWHNEIIFKKNRNIKNKFLQGRQLIYLFLKKYNIFEFVYSRSAQLMIRHCTNCLECYTGHLCPASVPTYLEWSALIMSKGSSKYCAIKREGGTYFKIYHTVSRGPPTEKKSKNRAIFINKIYHLLQGAGGSIGPPK